jgi:hypothetical protein
MAFLPWWFLATSSGLLISHVNLPVASNASFSGGAEQREVPAAAS